MKDCKFKQLILDIFREWEKPEREFSKTQFGAETIYKNFFAILYGAISKDSFSDIKDINRYMEMSNPNMIMIKSRVTNQEVEVYDYQLEDYSIDGDNLIIQFKNKEIIFQM